LKRKLLKISELKFDEDIYPRVKRNWLTAYSYSQAMKVGDVFPPIHVGIFQGEKYVVDGWHRVEACKLLGIENVEALVKNYKSKREMFADAVRFNAKHGRPLSVQEKVRIIHKLEELKFTLKEISQIVKVPLDKIERFKVRVVRGVNGKPIYLKSIVAKAKATEKAKVAVDQTLLSVRDVYSLLEQLIELLESGALSFREDEKLRGLAVRVYGLLGEQLELKVTAR